ncbi:MAG: M48 family metallopeptidase [Anaerolineae bacterium]|jgi:hypothetical protein|nr:M48 family metallopeptidase [Anaerolineae bacterium]
MNRKTPAGLHQITYGTTDLTFTLLYSKRKTLGIRIHPDRTVTVDAPTGTPLERVREVVQRKGAWITRKLREFEAYTQPVAQPRQYISGEVYRYLGQQIRLKVETGTPVRVILTEEVLAVTAPTAGHVASLVQGWYRRQAERVFAERMTVCLPLADALGIPRPEKLTVREMKTRWGSCSGRGRITLNLRLVQVETDLIDYVILHELCHLKELNHSKRFYALMTHILPDWKEKRQRLNRSPIIL